MGRRLFSQQGKHLFWGGTESGNGVKGQSKRLHSSAELEEEGEGARKE